jgi:hypothetical protein
MGGILAADVALIPAPHTHKNEALKHRILGLINFDVPFLGMHPGVVATGLGSLFQPQAQTSPNLSQADLPNQNDGTSDNHGKILRLSSYFMESFNDPNFDPAFHNDKRLTRHTQLGGAINFFKKNSDRITRAAREYISSYVQFGSCLADYSGLQRRYQRLIELEELDEYRMHWNEDGRRIYRIRFVNYYTASTGFIKSDTTAKKINRPSPESVQLSSEARMESRTSGKDHMATMSLLKHF